MKPVVFASHVTDCISSGFPSVVHHVNQGLVLRYAVLLRFQNEDLL